MDILNPVSAITGIASTIGGWFDNSGKDSANAYNQANINAVTRQRQWSERMANTAYQRTVQDMDKAGLNPMLALKLGGATTPPTGLPNLMSTIEGQKAGANTALGHASASLARVTALKETANARSAEVDARLKMLEERWIRNNLDDVLSAKHFGTVTKVVQKMMKMSGQRVGFSDFGKGFHNIPGHLQRGMKSGYKRGYQYIRNRFKNKGRR